jgi:hypothetical protein
MPRLFLLLTALSALFPQVICGGQKTERFISPDGSMVALVIHVGKEPGFESYESRVEFRNKDGKILCTKNYSSEDSQHGYGVAKAAWTPDSQFFVYSLRSSGGHSPWHTPIQFYNRQQAKILSLDDALENAVSNPEFKISEPDKVTVTVYFDEREITVRLSEISQKKHIENRSRK